MTVKTQTLPTQVFPAITTTSCSEFHKKVSNIFHAMPEFTVVLNDDNTFDIFIDGERCYFGFDTQDLKEFAQDFIDSNTDN